MSDIDNGVVADEAGSVATEQNEVSDEGVTPQVAAEVKADDQQINWSRANETMRQQSQRIREMEEQLNRLSSPAKKELFDGRDHDDIVTVKDMKEAFREYVSEQQGKIAQLETKAQYPDMMQVIEKYGKSLPNSAKSVIINSENPYLTAYELCKESASYYKDNFIDNKHDNAKKIAENSKKPGNVSSVGSTGAISRAAKYEAMDYSEILAMSDKFIRG